MSVKKLLLFDIDGTLLMTGGVGAFALTQVFREMFSVEDAWKELVPDGKTDFLIMDELASSSLGRLLTREECAYATDRYHEIFEEHILGSEGFRLLPGVPVLLEILSKRKDLALGIATGNFEKAAWLKLRKGNIHNHFHFGGFGSDSAHRAELTQKAAERGFEKIGRRLDPQNVWVIGDTQHDITAGKSMGARTAGVTTGRMKAADFKPYAPDYVLSDLTNPAEFLRMLEIE